MKRGLVLVALLFSLALSARAQVILNEVLANEPGGSTALEWVELYNSDTVAVSLANWEFGEGGDTTLFSSQAVIASKSYLVLARKLVSTPPDVNSFEARWGDGSGVWGDSPIEDFPAVEAKMSLANSAGTVTLIAPDNLVQTFTWSKDAGDGISWEKVDSGRGDDSSNWRVCTLPPGSSPGKINSVALAENDLAVEKISAQPVSPGANGEFDLSVKVQNRGTANSAPSSLSLFDDLNFNLILDSNESLAMVNIPSLPPSDVFTSNTGVALAEGNHRVVAEVGGDDKNYNNQMWLDLKVGESLPDVIINEIMAAPDLNQNQAEWVELYNRSGNSVSLKGWFLGDSKQQAILTEDILELPASQFLILSADKNKFLASYPSFAGAIIQPASWQTLDNDGDEVILKDSLGFLAEKVSYPTQSLKGVSWERIDYDKKASDTNNWWRSVDSSGATPGRPNSVLAAFSSSIEVKIEPNPFSPDEDGFDDQTEIEFKIPLGVELTMKIYDRKGRPVRTLFENEPKVSGKINWDGRKDDGSGVRSGVYILFVETKGDKREVKKATIAVTKQK